MSKPPPCAPHAARRLPGALAHLPALALEAAGALLLPLPAEHRRGLLVAGAVTHGSCGLRLSCTVGEGGEGAEVSGAVEVCTGRWCGRVAALWCAAGPCQDRAGASVREAARAAAEAGTRARRARLAPAPGSGPPGRCRYRGAAHVAGRGGGERAGRGTRVRTDRNLAEREPLNSWSWVSLVGPELSFDPRDLSNLHHGAPAVSALCYPQSAVRRTLRAAIFGDRKASRG